MTLTHVAENFATARPPQPLSDDEIHLWFFPQWERAPDAAAGLPVRTLLSAYLNRPVGAICIERGEHGKPRVADAQLQFNLSHAANALLLGVSRNVTLGVDLESTQRKTRPALELARRFFAPAETEALKALPENLRQTSFLRLWCAKEAVLKAHGQGIGFGLDRVEFRIDSLGEMAPAADNPWQVVPLAPAPPYLGALAWRGPVSRVRAFVAQD